MLALKSGTSASLAPEITEAPPSSIVRTLERRRNPHSLPQSRLVKQVLTFPSAFFLLKKATMTTAFYSTASTRLLPSSHANPLFSSSVCFFVFFFFFFDRRTERFEGIIFPLSASLVGAACSLSPGQSRGGGASPLAFFAAPFFGDLLL